MNKKLKHLKICLTILAAFFFCQQSQAVANCHIDDWTALKAIYDSADGDNWTNRGGWSSYIDGKNTPPGNCNLNNLFGVTVQNGRVTKIFLWEKHRNGVTLNRSLPTGGALKKLSKLKVLSIKGFSLSGELPSFQSMPNLTELYLNENELSGSVPWQKLYRLNNLRKLRLDNNSFSGSLPNIGYYLTKLKNLFLGHNNFTGTIPSSYGNLSNLVQLTLQYNNLSGSFAANLSNLCGINWGDPHNYYINRGNNFNELWSSFCSNYRKTSSGNLEESGYLNQNSPNPTTGLTAIKYFIPEHSENAELVITDIIGKTVKAIPIMQTGAGSVQLSTVDLPEGIYAYTLYSNTEMLASKKMIIAQQ